MLTTSNRLVLELAQCLSNHGVREVVLCPGSRNAPLCMEFSRCKDFATHVVVDERSAAFMALGIARQTGRIVAVVCTSGTAPLNFAPAMAEAYYAGVPLVAVTADRPERFIGILDSQTIIQPGIYNNYIKDECDLSNASQVTEFVPQLLAESVSGWPGPVHINVRIEEPISAVADAPKYAPVDAHPIESSPTYIDCTLLEAIAVSSGIIIVAGPAAPKVAVQAALRSLADKRQVVVVQDAPSNSGLTSEEAITAPDAFFTVAPPVAPDTVISIGGAPVSALLKRYLRSIPGLRHWSVGQPGRPDTYGALQEVIDIPPADFLNELARILPNRGSFSNAWLERWRIVRNAAAKAIDNSRFTAMRAVRDIVARLEPSTILHLSNGMTVRYAQFAPYTYISDVVCNRGVSGIEGSTSTAIGSALAAPERPAVLISGDMSAQYDMGALANMAQVPNLRMAVISNGGGNIFRTIAATRDMPCMEECLAGPVNFPAESLCKAFGIAYFRTEGLSTLHTAISNWLDASGAAMLEIIVNGPNDAKAYRHLFESIKNAIQ